VSVLTRPADHEAGGTSGGTTQRGFGHKPALDGLRAVAVLSVMAYHFGATWAPGGFLGVDMFFVLSGYLITSLLVVEWDRTSTLDFLGFWARRARRLLPALFLVLGAIAIWAAVVAHRDQLDSIRWDSLWTLFYGANWHFIASGQSYFDLFNEPSPLRHAWSLAIEEQFYLVWPLVAFVCLQLARGRRWLLGATCVVGIAGATLLMAQLYDRADPSRSYYGTDTRAGQLLVGALLALALLRWSPRTRAGAISLQALGLLGAAFVVWAFVDFGDTESWLYRGGFLLFAIATAAVVAAVIHPSRSPVHALLSVRPVRWVGEISYGLYLWHWPVVVAVTGARTGLSGWTLSAARLGLTFGAAALSFYLLELPIRRGSMFRGRVGLVLAPIAGLATAVVIVVATAGAAPPPGYLVARPDSVTAHRAPKPTVPPQESEAQLGVARMLLIGDSVADTLGPALQTEAAGHGVALQAITRPGCGLTTQIPLLDDGTPVSWGDECAAAAADYQSGTVRDTSPDVVLWLSTWETSDQIANGVPVHFGTRAGDNALLDELEAARQRLGGQGARLVLLTVPPPADTSEVRPLRADEASRRRHLNDLFRRFAARHPSDVAVADLAHIVCPASDRCPATRDGVVLRPRDGNHFETAGAAWVAPRLYQEILRALSSLPRTTTPAIDLAGTGFER
jgi:peptidoglycan/LPS O-acetylase OafA/YrhL